MIHPAFLTQQRTVPARIQDCSGFSGLTFSYHRSRPQIKTQQIRWEKNQGIWGTLVSYLQILQTNLSDPQPSRCAELNSDPGRFIVQRFGAYLILCSNQKR